MMSVRSPSSFAILLSGHLGVCGLHINALTPIDKANSTFNKMTVTAIKISCALDALSKIKSNLKSNENF